MNLWRWLSTPAEPKGQYALLTGIGTGALMLISIPLWSGGGIAETGIAGGICGATAATVSKLWMERGK